MNQLAGLNVSFPSRRQYCGSPVIDLQEGKCHSDFLVGQLHHYYILSSSQVISSLQRLRRSGTFSSAAKGMVDTRHWVRNLIERRTGRWRCFTTPNPDTPSTQEAYSNFLLSAKWSTGKSILPATAQFFFRRKVGRKSFLLLT